MNQFLLSIHRSTASAWPSSRLASSTPCSTPSTRCATYSFCRRKICGARAKVINLLIWIEQSSTIGFSCVRTTNLRDLETFYSDLWLPTTELKKQFSFLLNIPDHKKKKLCYSRLIWFFSLSKQLSVAFQRLKLWKRYRPEHAKRPELVKPIAEF